MRNPRMTQKPAIGIAVASIAIAFCCIAIAADLSIDTKPTAVDAEQYADFIENEVSDIQDLAEGAEIQRRMFNRITPPGISWLQPMFPSVMPFDSANFDEMFLDELLGEDKNSVAIYPLSLALDPKTRETLIYNADGKLIATIPADKTSRVWPEDADPARVTLQLNLLPSEDVEPYLYTESRISEPIAPVSMKSAKTGGAALKSLGVGEFGFCNIQKLTNGNMRLTVTNGTDIAEVYAYTVLHTSAVSVVTNEGVVETNILWAPFSPPFKGLENTWDCQTTNLVLTNGVGVWEDSNISSNARVRFYGVAKRTDSDGDGLADGAELFVYHSKPDLADTDGDGLTDLEELQLGTDLNASNIVQYMYFVDELPETSLRRSATESDMFVSWSNLQAKAMYTARYKDGYGEFTSSNLPASVPPKIYLTKDRSYQSECDGIRINPYGENGTMDFLLSQSNYCQKAFDPLSWPSTPTNHVCTGYSDFSRIYNSDCYYMIELAWDYSYSQLSLQFPFSYIWWEVHSTCPPDYSTTNVFSDTLDTCDFMVDWYGGLSGSSLIGRINPVSHTRSYNSRTGDHFLDCDSYSSPPYEMYEEVLTGEYTDTMLWDYTDADLQTMMTNWGGLAWGQKLVRNNHTYPPSTNLLTTDYMYASRYVYTNYNRIEIQALRFRWEIPTDTGVVYKIFWQEDYWPEENWPWSCSTELKECNVLGTGSTAYSTNFDILPPGSNGYIQLAPAARMVMEIYRPKVLDPDETMIPEEDKLTKGGVTFVNLDNDDNDALFDHGGASEDGVVDGGDDELVKIKLRIQTGSWAPSTARLIATAGATNIAVWTSSNKLAASAYTLGADLDPWIDFAYESNWFVKTMWVEGISAQTLQQGTKLKMEYVVGSSTNKDEVALTVVGVDQITWKGKGNSVSDGDTLDSDTNWPSGLAPNSWRVFPDARVVGGTVETNARDKVNVEVALSVAPPSEIKLYLKSFDVDDPTASTNAVDYESSADDNRGATPAQAGQFTGELSGVMELVFPENVKTTNCEFQTTMQPGDNFRVAANGDRDFFATLANNDLVQDVGGSDADKNANKQRIVCTNIIGTVADQEIRGADKYASDVLTIWRFLHVEVDSMSAPPATGAEKNTVDGTLTAITGNGTVAQRAFLSINLNTGLTPQDPSANLSGTGNGRFENGWIKIGSGTGTPGETQTIGLLGNGDDYARKDGGVDIPVLVSKTGQSDISGSVIAWSSILFSINVSSGTLTTNYNGGTLNVAGVTTTISSVSTNGGVNTITVTAAPAIPFVLHDDDSDIVLPRSPSVGAEACGIFAPAYVYSLASGGGSYTNNSLNVPFIRNVNLASIGQVMSSSNALQSSSNRLSRFWCGYAVYAFQFSVIPEQVGPIGTGNPPRGDSDPNTEAMIPGLSATGSGAIFFIEPLREVAALGSEQRLLVHEVAHQFGVLDSYISGSSPPDCVMGNGMYSPGAIFYPDALSVIRSRVSSPNN